MFCKMFSKKERKREREKKKSKLPQPFVGHFNLINRINMIHEIGKCSRN